MCCEAVERFPLLLELPLILISFLLQYNRALKVIKQLLGRLKLSSNYWILNWIIKLSFSMGLLINQSISEFVLLSNLSDNLVI